MSLENIDHRSVKSFGEEWSDFDQSRLSDVEARKIFEEYFSMFPFDSVSPDAEGFDMGCGSGRWAKFVAPRVRLLHCIDPSDAIDIARKNLAEYNNIEFHRTTAQQPGIMNGSQDFGYALGVIHHIPTPSAAIRSLAALLKSGAPLLLYLYYAFDNRPLWFRIIWQVSDAVRRIISRLPPILKRILTDLIAVFVYLPLARLTFLIERQGFPVSNIPLSYYRKHTLYTMRTDARDRFGTPLENRFTRSQIEAMMVEAGLTNIRFSNSAPYWCAIGTKVGYPKWK